MRFIVTALCMGIIASAAAALVVIDLIIKLLPLIIVALVAVAALRIWQRRRHPAAAPQTPPAALCNVPDAAAFVAASQSAGVRTAPHRVDDGRAPRYAAPHRQDHTVIDAEVIDAEVISEDDHRG